jgi:PAS domain-containing protein
MARHNSMNHKPVDFPLPKPDLDDICRSAAQAMDMTSAMLFLTQKARARMIASHGLPQPLRNLAWSFDQLPFKAGEVYVVTDASKNTFAMVTMAEFGLPIEGALIRLPVEVEPNFVLALFLFSDQPIKTPSEAHLRQLEDIAQEIRARFGLVEKLLVSPQMDLNIPRTLAEMKKLVTGFQQPAALFDENLKIYAGNAAAANILGVPQKQLVGKSHADFAPLQAEAVEFMLKHALQTKTSAPDFEINLDTVDEFRRTIHYSVTPFSPMDSSESFLFVTASVTTRQSDSVVHVSRTAPVDVADTTPDAAQTFLLDTLIERRSVRHRNLVSYLTLRTWRQPMRTYQINAFKALKQKMPPQFAEAIVADMADYLQQFIGLAAFKAIVPMPCGHSPEGRCLSLEIARHLSAQVNIPVIQVFVRRPHKGKSHPKQNTKRPSMILQRELVGPVLLVDDVATSGAHMEEAIKLLRPACGTVLAVAWIGSDSSKS